jgi:excisionase family DNA binding protein
MTLRRLVHRPPSAQHPGENRSRAGVLTKLRTIDETADRLSVSPRTVRRLIDSGALRAHHIGRLVRISDNEIATFLRSDWQ